MTDSAPPFPNAHAALLAVAHGRLDKTAIAFESERLTYADILSLVDTSARNLAARGIGRGVPFASYSQNRPELMACYYAAARLGAMFVPVNPNLTGAEVAYAVRHSGARILLHDDMAAEAARAAVPAEMLVPIDALSEPAGAMTHVIDADTRPDDDFLIIYTSGSTGTPKAIVLDHAAQARAPVALATMWGMTEADVTLVALPLGYLYGLSTAAAVGLQSGGGIALLRRFHPRDAIEELVGHGATLFHGVPTMFSMMLEYAEQHDLRVDLSGVRALICAGAPLPLEMRRRFARCFGKDLQNYYAMTEATPVFARIAGDTDPMPDDAVGKAVPGLTVRIVRPDGTDCAAGEQGEILVRAAATMSRYLGAPELTAAAFQDGLFRSGDLGHRDDRGFYYITGRIKDVIIRGGANIAPAEVEQVLAAHPAVQDAAVVGAPDRVFGEVPVAFVVLRHGATASAEDMIAHAGRALADFKVPRRYMFETVLPVGTTGKVDKAALRKRCAGVES